MMLVSIHSSSVWTERNSCIDTCLHASIHASEKPTCIDTNIHLYRYKRVKTVLSINFHSFTHQTIKTSSSPHAKGHKTLIPNYQISLKTQPKLTKIVTKPYQIHYSSTFLHQFGGSKPQISTFKGFINLGFVKILQVLRQKFKVIHSTS
jgi:hypothetical protein